MVFALGSRGGRAVAVFIALALLLEAAPLQTSSASVGPTTPLNLVFAGWTGVTAQPGDRMAQFNVTIQDLGLYTISGVNEYLNMSSVRTALTNSTGGTLGVATVVGTVGPGQIGSAIFSLDVLPTAKPGTYYAPLTVFYLNVTGFLQSETLPVPITIYSTASLEVIGSTWSSTTSGGPGGTQGDVADVLTVRVLNPNMFAIHNVTGVLGFSRADFVNLTGGYTSSSKASIPGAFNPGRYGALTFLLNIQQNATVGSVPMTLSVTFADQWGLIITQNLNFTVQVYGTTEPMVVQITQSVPVGQTSPVSFTIENIGSEPMYSPVISFNVSSPIVVAANRTFSNGKTLQPGGQLLFTTEVGVGPGVVPNIFQSTVSVSYTDIFGVARRQGFTFQLTVTGTIDLLLLQSSASQGSSNVTVSGLLLDEGTASAFFTFVNASIGAGSTTYGEGSTYVGLVTPSSPVPFTLVFPYSSPSASTNTTVSLSVNYQNNFRQTQTQQASMRLKLIPASQVPSSQGGEGTLYVAVAAAAVLVAALLGWAWYSYFRKK